MTENARLNKLLSAAVEQRDRYKAMFMLASDRPDVDWRGLPVNPEP